MHITRGKMRRGRKMFAVLMEKILFGSGIVTHRYVQLNVTLRKRYICKARVLTLTGSV